MDSKRIYKTLLATLIAELCVTAYAGAQTTNEAPPHTMNLQLLVQSVDLKDENEGDEPTDHF